MEHMELYLLRHAIAVDQQDFPGDDSERPLTKEGAKKMRLIVQGMESLGLSFNIILTSPYRRAQETAAIVASHFSAQKHVRQAAALKPRGQKRTLIDEIASFADGAGSVVLVGHEPYLSTLAAKLVFGQAAVGLNLKKGGLCKLDVNRIRYGRCARLEWVLTPRQLIALAV
jgi:phosphohistidine phosphatase